MKQIDQQPTPMSSPHVVMTIHFPVSARSFVLPQVKRLMEAGISAELWVQDSPAHRDFLDALDCPTRFVDCDLTGNPFKLLNRFVRLCQVIRAKKIQVLHAHQMRAAVLPLLAAWLMRVPVRVYQNHGLPYLGYTGLRRWVLRAIEHVNVLAATHVLLVSQSNLQAARDDGLLSAHQGHILHYGSAMGVDLSRFDEATKPQRTAQSRQKLSIAPSAFVLGYVGRPVARKGFHLLLKAWERTRLAEFGGVLLIAGCDQNDCKQALGHEVQGVIALGYVRDVDGFYAACDAIALPSDHEGFPTAMLEGAAAGLATIGSDVPGIRCTIIDGETGILVPPKDQAALARAIRQLAEYPNLRHMMGAAGRQRVVDKFQSHEVLNSLVHYYENVLGISIPEVEELRRKKAA